MISAERIVESWLREQAFDVQRVESASSWIPLISGTIKWSYKEWRFYLYTDLKFSAYNVFNCSYMEVSLIHPESINKISDWIKGNKR